MHLFALSRLRMHRGLIGGRPNVHIFSEADDIFFIGPPDAAVAAFRDWRQKVEDSHGVVNMTSASVWRKCSNDPDISLALPSRPWPHLPHQTAIRPR